MVYRKKQFQQKQNKVLKDAQELIDKLLCFGISNEAIATTLGILESVGDLNAEAMAKVISDLVCLLNNKKPETPENDIVFLITASLAHLIEDDWEKQYGKRDSKKVKKNVRKKI